MIGVRGSEDLWNVQHLPRGNLVGVRNLAPVGIVDAWPLVLVPVEPLSDAAQRVAGHDGTKRRGRPPKRPTDLWVDDRPQFNNAERNILSHFGISIDIVTSTNEALALVCSPDIATTYDLIISDIARPGEEVEEAGLTLLALLRKQCCRNPVIFYAGNLAPNVPPGAFGICNRAGDLFRLTFDAVEKSRARCAVAVVATEPTPTQDADSS